jgi:predicted 2-oxoglutarate/Fe(II)-dependent dioxygenase YbiX
LTAIRLSGVVSRDVLAIVSAEIARGTFELDQRAGRHHLELDRESGASPSGRLHAVLEASGVFQAAAWPAAIALPIVCRYEPRMGDDDHSDPPFMGASPPMRRDIAAIIALSDPFDCEGGELVIDADGVAVRYKGEPGDCLLFDPGSLRRIEPVRSGVLLVAALWVHSAVADPAERRILRELTQILEGVEHAAPAHPTLETLRHGFFDLLRMWTHYPRRR